MSFTEAAKLDVINSLEPRLRALYDTLCRRGIDIADLDEAVVSKLGFYEGQSKDKETSEVTVTTMSKIEFAPSWDQEPAFPIVQVPGTTKISYGKRPKPLTDGYHRTILYPDTQIGYWRDIDTGALTPMHDEAAMGCALEIQKAFNADRVVNLGDFVDFPEFSTKFAVHPEFVHTAQPALNRGHAYLGQQRAILGPPGSREFSPELALAAAIEAIELYLIGGNHDDRLGRVILQHARAALRLKPADQPDGWPVLSVPFLLGLEGLGCTFIGGYPAGSLKLAKGTRNQAPLFAVHERGLDVAKTARQQRQSYVQGHGHRVATHSETYELDGDYVDVDAIMLGCLARNDGAVPSTKGAPDDRGKPVKRIESWQQAVGLLTVAPDGEWSMEVVRIRNGRAIFGGKLYEAPPADEA